MRISWPFFSRKERSKLDLGASRNIVILFFLFVSLCVFFMPDGLIIESPKHEGQTSSSKKSENQVFKGASYFSFNNLGENTQINSEKIIHEGAGGKITLLRPFGEILSKDGKIDYHGEYGEIFPGIHSVHLYEGVSFRGKGIDVKSKEMFLNQKKGEVSLLGEVETKANLDKGDKLFLRSEKAYLNRNQSLINYKGQVKGRVFFKNDKFSGPLSFTSENLKYFSTLGELELSEDVTLDRDTVNIQSRKGHIFLREKKKGIRYFVLEDDVKFREKFFLNSGKAILRTGISQKLEGFGFDQRIVFSGYPRIKQLDDLIRGNEIIIRQKSELIEIINTNSKFKFEESN